MNQNRRDRLKHVLTLLESAEQSIDQVCSEEEDSLTNMPENLESSERYASMERAVDCLSDAIDNVQEAAGHVQAAIDS